MCRGPAVGCVLKQCDQSVISVSQGDLLKSLPFRQDTTNTRQNKSAMKSQSEIKANTLYLEWAFTLLRDLFNCVLKYRPSLGAFAKLQ